MMKHVSLGPWIAVICSCMHLILCSVITLEDRGYTGVLVAIHNSVPEDEKLISNLKILFANASKFLYDSTNHGVYFKQITIAIPPTWTYKPEYEVLPGSFFGSAHIRVDHPNPEYQDTPYTLQPGGCGEHGQYIHLTPFFVRELMGNTTEMFGTPERQLVHEWAHLRYGVFDEYGIPGNRRFPMFYYENGKIQPTSCIRNIKGWIESVDGGPCTILDGGQVDKDCIFIPDLKSQDAKASVMYMPFIPSIEGFCDGGDDRKHNVKAPTKHNAVCNYESTWSVIARHKDFQNIRLTRDVSDDLDLIFRLIQPPKDQKGRYVLALDVSGSMNGRPMKLLHRAATRLVEDRIPDGAYLGIVQFSTDAQILHGLTRVDNVTRSELSKSLPSADDGGRTAIGKGIQEAINVLKSGNVSPEAGLIILITDGEENVVPLIENVVPEIMTEKVIINAVAFGSDASEKLENITMMTGGKGYFFSNINGSRPASALDSAFLESVTSQADIEVQPVQLKDEMFDLHQDIMEKQVRIDSDLGKSTIFTVTSQNIGGVEVLLMSPKGQLYNQTNSEYSRDDKQRERIQIFLPQAEEGRWRIQFRRTVHYPIVVAFSVTSEPQDSRHQPIRVRAWLSDLQLTFPAHAKVFAEVKKGYRAVVGATVMATVDRPMGGAIDVTLRDDGVGADVEKNDGMYTGYFTHFNGNGRYAVVANVINDGQAKLKKGSKSSAGPPIPRAKGSLDTEPTREFSITDLVPDTGNKTTDDEDDTIGDPAPEFDRTSDAGAFRLDSWIPNAGDVIPPGDIMDLVVLHSAENYDTNMTEVTLQWTSPGDDLDSGNVSSLELWASADIDGLIKDVHNGFLIPDTSITNGTLEPMPPALLQRVTVLVPFPNVSDTIYFAMTATDEAGNVSPRHNVAAVCVTIKKLINESKESAVLRKQILEVEDQPPQTSVARKTLEGDRAAGTKSGAATKRDAASVNGDKSFKWWIVAVAIGAVFGLTLLVIALGIIVMRKTKKKSYSSVATREQKL